MRSKGRAFDDLAVAAAPALFVLLWSTGFIGAKFGLPYSEALTLLSLRFLTVLAIVAPFALLTRAPWPRGADFWHNVAAGLLVQGLYLAGVFLAIDRGMPAGIAALIVGLQPLLTATIASRLLGEAVRPLQWLGLVLGVGGLYLVVADRTASGEASLLAWGTTIMALFAITIGTLYQKHFAGETDIRAALPVQFGAALLLCGSGSLLLETEEVQWTGEFVFALAWLSIVLSCGAIFLFYALLRRTDATRLTGLFYLVPPVTALISYFLFGERLGWGALIGMGVCVVAVMLVTVSPTAVRR